jgi:hypothetical protein
VCRASQDHLAPLDEQAAIAAAVLGSPAGFLEDASYWKLRELSISLVAPESWAAKLGAERLGITLAGRNLATWTGYDGLDPEVSANGYESYIASDNFNQPAVRYALLRLDIAW